LDSKSGLLDVFSQRLTYLGQRQSVLAQNVANADTPGYVPRDLDGKAFERLVAGRSPELRTSVTRSGHLAGTLEEGGSFKAHEQRNRYETMPSGNAVVLEEQLANVAENQMQHSTVTNLYAKYVQMFKTALGRSQG